MAKPRVTIGIPVRNGQKYLPRAIDSLLAQTFADFELIICDNASGDATETICRDYAAKDSRVRYIRNTRNLGPAANHNRCVALSRGEYFRWHAHDDMCAPTHLERCVAALDEDADAVIAYPRTLIIDENDEPLDTYDFRPDTSNRSPARRFSQLVLVNHRKHRAIEIFGLMRASALLRTPLEGAYARGDSVLLARMALLGTFVELPERLFFSRSHTTQSMQTMPTVRANLLHRLLGTGPLPPPEWWDASRKGKANFPEWNLLKQYIRSVPRAGISLPEQARCYWALARWVALNVPKLGRDVVYAAELMINDILVKQQDDFEAGTLALPRSEKTA